MERFEQVLPPPAIGLLGPGLLITTALLTGSGGPVWLGLWITRQVRMHYVLGVPWVVILPALGIAMLMAGLAWIAALRDAATATRIELVGTRLTVGGVTLHLTANTRLARDGGVLRVHDAGQLLEIRTSDLRALTELEEQLVQRRRGAGTAGDVPTTLRRLTEPEGR